MENYMADSHIDGSRMHCLSMVYICISINKHVKTGQLLMSGYGVFPNMFCPANISMSKTRDAAHCAVHVYYLAFCGFPYLNPGLTCRFFIKSSVGR